MIWAWQANLNRTGFLVSVITLEYSVMLERELKLIETIVFLEKIVSHHTVYIDTWKFLMCCRKHVILKPLQTRNGFEVTMQYNAPCEAVRFLMLNLVFLILPGELGEGCRSWGLFIKHRLEFTVKTRFWNCLGEAMVHNIKKYIENPGWPSCF